MRDVSFGQYYPTGSVIHRLDPRAKIIFMLIYMVIIFFVASYCGYALVALFLFTVTAVAKIPIKTLFKSVKAILVLMIFTAVINIFFYHEGKVLVDWWIIEITLGGIDFAIKMALRISLLVMGTSLLSFTTTPVELTDAIESLLHPLTYIKVPVHDIALIMSIALRFIPGLMDETDKIMMAQKARGAEIDTGGLVKKIKAMLPVLIPLFVSAIRRADELADALDARCYNASKHRTKMKVLKFGVKDAVATLIVLAFATLILLDKYLLGGLDGYIVEFVRGLVG